ncbi:MAG: metallophosphoesterase [Chromatiales bacterium]
MPLFTIAHISDLHFGREIAVVRDGLMNCLNSLQADVIILSGDLTQRARHGEFRNAVSFLEQLDAPVFIIPGNHDLVAFNLLERFVRPWYKWRHYIGDDLEPTMQGEGFFIKGINTARKLGDRMDWSRGGINTEQLADIKQSMSSAPQDSLKLLVAHHPFWLPTEYERRHLIDGRDEALPELKNAGVDLILSGHIHLDFTNILQGMVVSHAGTGISDRLMPGYPNSFNLLQGNNQSITLSVMEWRQHQFETVRTERFQRTEQGWQNLGEHDLEVTAR